MSEKKTAVLEHFPGGIAFCLGWTQPQPRFPCLIGSPSTIVRNGNISCPVVAPWVSCSSLDYSFQEFKPARRQEKKAFSFGLIYYLQGHISIPECSHVYPNLRKILSCHLIEEFIFHSKKTMEWSNGYTHWMKIIRSEI